MPDVRVVLAGSERSVEQGTTAAELLSDDKSVIVARVNGALKDLAYVLRRRRRRRAGDR